MFQLPLDAVLEILSSASVDDHPYLGMEKGSEELGEAFTGLVHAVVKFVTVGRDHLGYDETRETLERLVGYFPEDEDASAVDPFAALLALLEDASPCGECDGCKAAEAEEATRASQGEN